MGRLSQQLADFSARAPEYGDRAAQAVLNIQTTLQTFGMRIDLAYATEPLVDRIRWALVDRFARKGKLPSDHAPLLVDIDVDAA